MKNLVESVVFFVKKREWLLKIILQVPVTKVGLYLKSSANRIDPSIYFSIAYFALICICLNDKQWGIKWQSTNNCNFWTSINIKKKTIMERYTQKYTRMYSYAHMFKQNTFETMRKLLHGLMICMKNHPNHPQNYILPIYKREYPP